MTGTPDAHRRSRQDLIAFSTPWPASILIPIVFGRLQQPPAPTTFTRQSPNSKAMIEAQTGLPADGRRIKIKGAKRVDLRAHQSIAFELVINLKTVKTLRFTVPHPYSPTPTKYLNENSACRLWLNCAALWRSCGCPLCSSGLANSHQSDAGRIV